MGTENCIIKYFVYQDEHKIAFLFYVVSYMDFLMLSHFEIKKKKLGCAVLPFLPIFELYLEFLFVEFTGL